MIMFRPTIFIDTIEVILKIVLTLYTQIYNEYVMNFYIIRSPYPDDIECFINEDTVVESTRI